MSVVNMLVFAISASFVLFLLIVISYVHLIIVCIKYQINVYF